MQRKALQDICGNQPACTFTDGRDIGEYNLRNRIRKTAAECRACYQDKPRAGKNGRRIMGSCLKRENDMETKEVMERKVLLTEIICMLKEKPVKDLRFVYHLLLRMA